MKKRLLVFCIWAFTVTLIVSAGPVQALAVTAGEQLYNTNCYSCHGPGGQCGAEESVQGEDAEEIAEAIADEDEMNYLSFLTTQEVQDIANYLDVGGHDDDDDDDHEGDHHKGKASDDEKRDGSGSAPDPATIAQNFNNALGSNLIALHNGNGPSYNSDCVSCHGDKSSGRALDGREDAHAEMVSKSPGCTDNEKCAWCHQFIEMEPGIQAGAGTTAQTASLRKSFDVEKCTHCHALGTKEEFYAD